MRLEADEEEMYTRMDRRDLYRRFSAILAAAGVVFLILIAAGYRSWQMIYFALVSIAGGLALFACYRNKEQYVMDMSGCFLEIREGILTVCQPLRAQEYETAKIDSTEVGGLAEEKKSGCPRFYVMLQENSRNSRITAGGNSYKIIRVESFGYDGETFRTLFLNFRDEVSKGFEVSPLKISVDKKWRKRMQFPFPVLYLFLYFVPVAVSLLSYH
ncbi:hypothetical protein LK537_08040 [Lachnoclostridium pacaense]|uniref:hypothetical protein n=1 Tax=Enterocloster hominis (ex Hitch et al. 2024) TaxID=1917870 RepID=UPI001D12BD68|nr:hypothetical protein [Lachnoclostridium pacaense]MCC2817237.1 hypothetical protein [Lachnoclostridium pacaense]